MVVIKTNGKIIPLNAKSTSRFAVKAEHRQSLLSEDTLQIALESKYPIEFNIGDKIEHNGRFFTLNFAPKVKREQGFYQYDLVFEGSQYHLRNKVFFNLDKTGFQTTADFPLTGEIDIFLRTLIANINSLNKGTWILGEFPQNTETKTLTFNGENCLAVLQKICQEYDTEFEIIENITAKTYTLNIKKIGEVLDFTFEYGKGNGLYSLTRENINNDVVTRLYAYGSTENIANDYRDYSDRLRMPQTQGDFIQDENKVRLFGLKEAVKHFDDIKPTFKGIVSRVGAFDERTKTQEIFVENMDFDLNERDQNGTKWLINDTPAKLHFNKGNLAGYDFELIKNGGYNHDTKCFKVKQWTDERGQKFPDIGTIFEFAVGDEFTLIDIVMPDEYITRAENKLWEEAKKEYEKQSKNNTKYSLEIDPLFLKNKFSNGSKIFDIGDYIRIIDRELGVDKTSRIMNISQNILNPFEYKLDIADDYEINFTISVLNDIKDTKTIVKTQTQINRQNYLNGIRNLAELRDNIFDTEGYFDPIHIKPNSIEANMLTIGAKNQQFALENVTLNPNVNGNPNSLYISGGKLVHFSISENIKEWTLLPIHRNDLANLTYYVYAKVGINDSFGTWEITTEKIKFNERSGYYYFLCYLLYTPKEGKRDAEAMYGNVMMHGGQISAGRIKSLNGQTYIDLDTGEIFGKITFLPNSPALTQVQGMVDNINIGARNLILNSKNDREIHRWETYPETYIYYDILGGTLEPNTEYTLTWEYMTIGNIKPMMAYFVSNVGEHRYIDGINHSNTWTKKQWTFRTGSNPNQSGIIRFDHKGSIDGQNCILKTRLVKIEKGNKPTEWTPAPEDIEASISTAQNTANQAIGLTQAQTANIIALQNKTDFLSNTAINGNGVATGTLIVGNGWGANAGITGLGGNQDVFLWGGTDYSNKNNAPISLHRDGFLRVRNAQGRVIFEIGQQNGDAVFNIYNNNGVKVAGIGQRGIEFLGYIPEDYTQNNFLHIQSSWDNEFDIINEIKGYLVGEKLDEAPIPKTVDNNWVYVRVSIRTNAVSYYYQAGNNFETAHNTQYIGYYQTRNKLGTKTPNGIYAVYTKEYVMKGNVAHHTRPNVPIYNEQTYYTGDFALNVTLYQILDGKIIRQKSLIVNSNLNQVVY